MTQAKTIESLKKIYINHFNEAINLAARRDNLLASADVYAARAEEAGSSADELAAVLRQLDPEHAVAYPAPEVSSEPTVADGLRELATLFTTHPELAEHLSRTIQHSVSGDTAAERIQRVEQIADLIGVEPRWSGTHYQATLKFAGDVQFLAVTTTSYDGAPSARLLPPGFVRQCGAGYVSDPAAACVFGQGHDGNHQDAKGIRWSTPRDSAPVDDEPVEATEPGEQASGSEQMVGVPA